MSYKDKVEERKIKKQQMLDNRLKEIELARNLVNSDIFIQTKDALKKLKEQKIENLLNFHLTEPDPIRYAFQVQGICREIAVIDGILAPHIARAGEDAGGEEPKQ